MKHGKDWIHCRQCGRGTDLWIAKLKRLQKDCVSLLKACKNALNQRLHVRMWLRYSIKMLQLDARNKEQFPPAFPCTRRKIALLHLLNHL